MKYINFYNNERAAPIPAEIEGGISATIKRGTFGAALVALSLLSTSALGSASSDGLETAVASAAGAEQTETEQRPEEVSPVEEYSALLDIITKHESNGNYNAYFGSIDNDSIIFTSMTISKVLQWQNSARYSAVGKYQIINSTLVGLVEELGIGMDEIFDENMQDRLAVTLLRRRGLADYLEGRITREQFAHNLAKEWAALPTIYPHKPRQQPTDTYYFEDGINKVHTTIPEILDAIDTLALAA
ncbi:hypothetical protein BH23PAT1_BH23PAT1_4050 [soil metagenome]